MADTSTKQLPDRHPDPITDEPGAHPVGTGVGAAAGGAAAGLALGAAGVALEGALLGTVAGPVGAAVGAVVGGVAGGLIGKRVAEQLHPTVEDAYWMENYRTRPDVEPNTSYDDYRPAYEYGSESRTRYTGRTFEAAEPDLQNGWDTARGQSKLTWDKARGAVRDAWYRLDRPAPDDANRERR